MEDATLWTWCSLLGLFVLGGAVAAAFWAAPPSFTRTAAGATTLLGGLVFVDLFLASALGAQVYRRGGRGAPLVGAGSGALFVLGFFGTILGIGAWQDGGLRSLDVPAAVIFLAVAPVMLAALSAGGTLFLADGVRRYRAEHGLKHAPR